MMRDHLCRMARYNRWANRRLYDACEQLSEDVYHRPSNMFFGSIHGTLNHILVGDRLWLARLEKQPAPKLTLDEQPFTDLSSLKAARGHEDDHMIDLTNSYSEADLATVLKYRTVTKPADMQTPLYLCWLHVFNHQTHHRGQVHDQLSKDETSPPSLDLMHYLHEQG